MGVLNLTIVFNDNILNVQVDTDTSVETLKAILECDTNVPAAHQVLLFGTNPLRENTATLGASGVNDGDVLQLMAANPAAAAPRPTGPPQAAGAGANAVASAMADCNPDGSLKLPAAFVAALRQEPSLMATIRSSNPVLAQAIDTEDFATIQEVMRQVNRGRAEQAKAMREEQELRRMEEADPTNPEIQKKIYELIQSKNIEENYLHAMEHTPEVFTQVEMLYVDMEINGVPVKAFVDSGAQMSIMTQDFASKCHIDHLIDKRFQGMAVGVGQSKIIGKVHQAPAKVGRQVITTAITVLEQKSGPQFIFGLDNLRRHQCCIDLKRQVLSFGSCDTEIGFLPEARIPKDFQSMIEEKTEEEAAKSMAEGEKGGGASSSAPSQPQPSAPSQQPAPQQATPTPSAATTSDPAAAAEEAKLRSSQTWGMDGSKRSRLCKQRAGM